MGWYNKRRRKILGVPRYCGRVKILVLYTENEQYRCTFVVNGRRVGTEVVKAPASATYAVDSPQAYDDVAHAALSFAVEEGTIDESDCDFNDRGFRVRRVPR